MPAHVDGSPWPGGNATLTVRARFNLGQGGATKTLAGASSELTTPTRQ